MKKFILELFGAIAFSSAYFIIYKLISFEIAVIGALGQIAIKQILSETNKDN
jgi:hypothetical protein